MRIGSLPRPLYSFILGREKSVLGSETNMWSSYVYSLHVCTSGKSLASPVMATILHEAVKHGYYVCSYMPYTGRILIQLIYTQIIVIQCARV